MMTKRELTSFVMVSGAGRQSHSGEHMPDLYSCPGDGRRKKQEKYNGMLRDNNNRCKHPPCCHSERFVPADTIGDWWRISVVKGYKNPAERVREQISVTEASQCLHVRIKVRTVCRCCDKARTMTAASPTSRRYCRGWRTDGRCL